MSTPSRLEELAQHYDGTDTSSDLREATGLERVREIAEAEGLTTSALIRRWIEAGIDAHR